MQTSKQFSNSPSDDGRTNTTDGLDHIFTDRSSADMSDTPRTKKVELPVAEAAKALGISERTLWRRIEDGELKSRLKGHKRLVKVPIENVVAPNGIAMNKRDVGTVGTVIDLKEMLDQLTAANYRVGYLQGQLQEKEQQLRLLPDLQNKADEASLLRASLAAAEAEIAYLKKPWWKRLFGGE